MIRRRHAVFVAGALAVVAACSLPSATDFARSAATPDASVESGRPSTADASAPNKPTDAGSADAAQTIGNGTSDGGDAGDAGAIVDLLGDPQDSYFDNGSCGPDSGGYQATLSASTPAHSGAGACQVCRSATSAGDLYTLDTQLLVQPRVGETYHASCWVRRPPGSTDTTPIGLTLRTHNGDFNGIDQIESPEVMLSDVYQQLTLTLHVTQNTSTMDVYIGSVPPTNLSPACFLVDDLLVWRD